MGTITSGIGLVSGLNTTDIINQLMKIESQPKTQLQTQMTTVSQQKQAFTALKTQLDLIKGTGTTLKDATAFQAATTTSSDPNVLSATATKGAAIGSYQFQVARLVTTQQSVSAGFSDVSTTPIGAGTITIDQGGGEVTADNTLGDLNGGAGVNRGIFKITDRSGATATIDTSDAVTLDDVLKKINTASGVNVKATISGNHLLLTDQTGKTTSDLIVQDVGNGSAASSLGIAADSLTSAVTGTNINYLSNATTLTQVNDGNGIRLGSGGTDLNLDPGDGGGAIAVSLGGANTIGDVVKAINTASGARLKATITASGLTLTSSGGAITATDANGSKVAEDLGLTGGSQSGGVLTGAPILADIGTTLVSALNGGQGLSLGAITIQSRAAGSAASIDLSGAKTVQQILDTINNAAVGVKAAVSRSGAGISITDTSGGSGNLVIGGASATTLGLAGSFDTNTATVNGANLHHQYISANSLLSSYNGGNGVDKGSFTITDSKGAVATLDLSKGNLVRLSDIIANINSRGIGVVASINNKGNGLLLTDTAGGPGKLTVADVSGTTAADLNIAGTAGTTGASTIDGSFEKSIAVTSTDTLTTLQTKINNLGFGVSAQIVNDGSTSAPYRLSLTARGSGKAGRVVIDDGSTNLGTQTLIQAQDAAVFVGGQSAAQPLLITSSKNTLSNVINGVSITLNGVSNSPITLNVTRDSTNVSKALTDFVTNFNNMIEGINTLTQFDTTTNKGGLLLGDSTVQQIQAKLYDAVENVVKGAGKYNSLTTIGITITDGAKLTFDQTKFDAAYAADPTAVQNLFTQADTGAAVVLEKDMNALTDPVSGVITVENKTLDNRTSEYQTRMDELNALLDGKRSRLQTQFANLESVLSGLQSQQSALSSFTGITPTSSSSSSSKTG